MKFVKSLVTEEIYTLEELQRNRSDYRSRVRAHAILLSSRGYSIKEIAKIYQIDRDTVSIWIKNWETHGIVGLFDEKKSGRPPILNENEQKQTIEFVKDDPKSLKKAVSQIEENFDKSVSTKTVKRILKKAKYIWKRVRTSLKGKRDPEKFKLAKNEIATLIGQQFNNEINFYVNNILKATISSTKLSTSTLKAGNIQVNGTAINNTDVAQPLTLAGNGTGSANLNGVRAKNNSILTPTNAVLPIVSLGTGYVKFAGSTALAFPVGTNSNKPATPERGATRYNTDLNYHEIYDTTMGWIPVSGVTLSAEQIVDTSQLWSLILGY